MWCICLLHYSDHGFLIAWCAVRDGLETAECISCQLQRVFKTFGSQFHNINQASLNSMFMSELKGVVRILCGPFKAVARSFVWGGVRPSPLFLSPSSLPFSSPSSLFPFFATPFYRNRTPQIQLGGLEKHSELPQRRNRIWRILSLKYCIWWPQF